MGKLSIPAYRHLSTSRLNGISVEQDLNGISPKLLVPNLRLLFYADPNGGSSFEFLCPLRLEVVYFILESVGAAEAVEGTEGDWGGGTRGGAGWAGERA
jgi:hypothetical protein